MSTRVSVEDYRAFVAVVDSGSFVRAAHSLFLTQSALSRRIAKLEEVLGARLLDRDSRKVSLTAIGRAFEPIAKQVLHGFERSLDEIRDVIQLRAGAVTVGSMLTVANHLLPAVVARFAGAHPGVRVRILDDFGPKILEAVNTGEAEFAIVLEPAPHPRLDFEALIDDPYVLVMREDHLLAQKRKLRWRDLEGHPFVRLGEWNGNQARLSGEEMPARVLENAAYEVQHISTLLALVAEGAGIAAAPRLAVLAQAEHGVVYRALREPLAHRRIGLVRIRGRALSPAAEALRVRTIEALAEAAC